MKSQYPHLGATAALACLALTSRTDAQVDPNFYVFLALGQSNMEGNAALPTPAVTLSTRYQELSPVTCSGSGVTRTEGQWGAAASPIVRCDTKFSLLEYFGKTLTDSLPSNIRIGIVPVAVAGVRITGLYPVANVAYYTGSSARGEGYMATIAAEYGGDTYARLVAMGKVAQQTGVIKGILFHQGESWAGGNPLWPDSVKTIYNSLLSDLGLKAANVPLLAGETATNTGANTAIDGLPNTIPTSYVISSQGLPYQSDGLHFTVPGYETFGTRYAVQMLGLLRKASASIEPGMHSEVPGLSVTTSAWGVVIRSEVAMDRVSLVAVDGRQADLGSGVEVRILPGQFRPGVYFLRAASGASVETRSLLISR